MKPLFRKDTDQPGITDDYHKVRAFFVKLGYAEFERFWRGSAAQENAVRRKRLWVRSSRFIFASVSPAFDMYP